MRLPERSESYSASSMLIATFAWVSRTDAMSAALREKDEFGQ